MKGPTNGNPNSGLSGGETAGLVVGILGLILAALTLLKGWKSKTDQSSPTVTNNIYCYPPPDIPVSATQDIPLQPIPPQPHPPSPPLLLKPLVPSHPKESRARGRELFYWREVFAESEIRGSVQGSVYCRQG
ncbi:hypothetical protein BDD12DRAFT_979426 [Trichophaea hybrida]|nr:hypothetical protein BDD12DRAFT_979426 [Trichophaea hybrida]